MGDTVREELRKIKAKTLNEIFAQREEIVQAFIAKYGIQPEEAVQVIQFSENKIFWKVQRIPSEGISEKD